MRSVDPAYSEWLLQMGNGTLANEVSLGEDIIEIPQRYVVKEGTLVAEIFGKRISVTNVENLYKRAILCPKNESVDEINVHIMNILEGDFTEYCSDDTVECDDPQDAENFPVEYLHTLVPSGMPPHLLKLKRGTVVMLLRNLNSKEGLCNGTRLVVKELKNHMIVAKVITGSAEGQDILLPRIILTSSDGELPFKLRRNQFPVKPAFAMTINKAQGQTFEKVGIFLPETVFGHGQLYVAFSRVKRADDVKIEIHQTSQQGALLEDPNRFFTRNVLYREVLM